MGGDVILDYGCWARVERDDYRNGQKSSGADFKLHYMDVPYSELYRRLENEIETSLKARLKFPKRKWIDTSLFSNRRPETSLYKELHLICKVAADLLSLSNFSIAHHPPEVHHFVISSFGIVITQIRRHRVKISIINMLVDY